MESNPISFKEQRIRKITNLYYSNPEIQNELFNFSKNREVCPRYFEGFGKRPDVLEYPGDVFELVKKGATSFNCSEELWSDPLKLETGMNERQLNDLRIGWDLLIDIDCKYIDYSKKAAQAIIQVFKEHFIKNYKVKFSGNKGFHIILPFKAFPKQIAGQETKNLFPELPRKILAYVRFKAEDQLRNLISEEELDSFKGTKIKRGIKCNNCKEIAQEYDLIEYFCPKCSRREIKRIYPGAKREFKCPDCRTQFEISKSEKIYECKKCNISSKDSPHNFSRHIEIDLFDLMGLDLILISPRHLFRAPYSLHESSGLASIVLDEKELEKFDLKDASPLNVKVKNFMPNCKAGEAEYLVREALDWVKQNQISSGESKEILSGKYADFKPIKLENVSQEQFPPCIKNILKGMADGKKRSLFVLINFLRSAGIEKETLEKIIYDWNKKNSPPLREGYIQTQLLWAYKKKPTLPPNCREFYQNLGVCQPDELCNSIKNPVNYLVRKNYILTNLSRKNKPQKQPEKQDKKTQPKVSKLKSKTSN